MTTTIAMIAADRSVWTLRPDGKRIAHSLVEEPVMWGSWNIQGTDSAPFSWPTWSSDGLQLACFRLPHKEHPNAAVFVMNADGVQAMEVASLGDRLPIYLYWSPDDRSIAVLTQRGDTLQLSVLDTEEPGRETSLAKGSPLFFTWADTRHVVSFVGGSEAGPQLRLLHTGGKGPDEVLAGRPGNFCAPLWMDDTAVFVHHEPGRTELVAATSGQAEHRVLERLSGLVAMAAGPDGRTIARAVATDGDGTPYRRLGLVDVHTGEVQELSDEPCLAYLWSPAGDAIITARVDTQRNLLSWTRVGLDGSATPVAELYPSRDIGFYLRFFEQYSQSHHLMDPSGRYLLLPGNLLGHGDPSSPGRLWRVDTHTGDAEDIGDGVFGVYAPS